MVTLKVLLWSHSKYSILDLRPLTGFTLLLYLSHPNLLWWIKNTGNIVNSRNELSIIWSALNGCVVLFVKIILTLMKISEFINEKRLNQVLLDTFSCHSVLDFRSIPYVQVTNALKGNTSLGVSNIFPGSMLEGNFGAGVGLVQLNNLNASLQSARRPDLVIFTDPGSPLIFL